MFSPEAMPGITGNRLFWLPQLAAAMRAAAIPITKYVTRDVIDINVDSRNMKSIYSRVEGELMELKQKDDDRIPSFTK